MSKKGINFAVEIKNQTIMKTIDTLGKQVTISENEFIWNALWYLEQTHEFTDSVFFARSDNNDGIHLSGKELKKLCRTVRSKFA